MTLLQILCLKLEQQIQQHEKQGQPDRETIEELKAVYSSFKRRQQQIYPS